MVLEYIKQLIEVYWRGRYIDDVVVDTRPQEEKDKDYTYSEDILLPQAASGKRIKKVSFEPYNQQQTYACGAFAAAHIRKLMEDEFTSPLVWYRTRSNYSRPGMFIKEVLSLAAKGDAQPDPLDLPRTLREEYANAMPLTKVFNGNRESHLYFQIKPFDSTGVFNATSAGKAVVVAFFSTIREWDFEMTPQDHVWVSTAPVRHYVTTIPGSVHTKDGHQWVSVVDSARQGTYYLRHIRKDFLDQRMYLGAGFTDTIKAKVTKPKELPTWRVQYGQRSEEVRLLQRYLVTQGLMGERHTTGYYGNITAAAVLKWQFANIAWVIDLAAMQGHYWGPLSIKAVVAKHS